MLPLTQVLLEALAFSLKANSSPEGKNYYILISLEITICYFFPPLTPKPWPNLNTILFLVFPSSSMYLSQGQEQYSHSSDVSNMKHFPYLLGNSFHLPIGL